MTKSSQSHQVNQHHMKASLANLSEHDSSSDDQSPPISPLRLPQLSSSNSSIFSWTSASQGSNSSDSMDVDQCNSKEDRASYNTKFAKYHLETYRQNDRMRWNFDFDHNRPLDDSAHHRPSSARYQWEPAV